MTVKELSERLGGELSGDGSLKVCALASLPEARPGDVSFVKDAKYARQAGTTRASAVLVPLDWQGECSAPALVKVKDPDAACTGGPMVPRRRLSFVPPASTPPP